MKKIIFLTILCITACVPNNNDKKLWMPRENIKVVLDSFVNILNDKNLIYEIYIDKIDELEYNLYIYGGRESLMKNPETTIKTEIKDVEFNIYSGFEHFFKSAQDTLKDFDDNLKDPVPEGFFS